MTPTTIPITVTPEAAARIAELGMQAELDRMLDHTVETVPGLRSIEVQLFETYDAGDENGLTIWSTRVNPHLADDPTNRQWGAWLVRTFPPGVCRYFCMLSVYEPDHAR